MILLNVANVIKRFGPEPVLDGVTFELRPGERVGLVGPNGAGKTTLLSILAGKLEPDSGTVELHSSARLDYLEQQPTIVPGRTLWDEAAAALAPLATLAREAEETGHLLAAAIDPDEHRRLAERFDRLQHELTHRDAYNIDHRIERVLEGLGFARDGFRQPVEQLSGGQHNRLLLARLLLAEPDVMLLDEPSNHLDIAATEWLERHLAASSQAMIVVSHDRYFLDKVTNHALELFDGTVDEYAGNFSAYWRQKAERLAVQARTYERQQEFIAKTEDFIRRNHSGQKHAQAEDRKKKLARVERVAPPRRIEAPPMRFAQADRTGDLVLRVERLAKAYDRPLFRDLSFDILRGQRWGILGPNGSGKTTLLRCLIGEETPDQGRAIVGARVRIGYHDQLLRSLPAEAEVVDAVRPPRGVLSEQERRGLLARFGITGDAAFQRVDSLSGGERSRAALAQLAAAEANFLVLDEPTNHLDLWARDALELALAEFDGTALLVSHDRYFLNRVVDHLLVVEPGRFRVVEGNYDAYVRLCERGLAGAGANGDGADGAAAAATNKESPRQKAGSKRSGRGEKPARSKRQFPYRKVEDLEADIFAREARIAELHALLATPDVLRDGDRVRSAQTEIAEHRAALESLYPHWEEAIALN
ncbi:MAG: ABC-F family ATP-binding cassette domain-containing protein [Planctomycetia bacterium]|nr:ABC-F family ATP-binding cassette domain-containing protein [Planctomycetia bacterium]